MTHTLKTWPDYFKVIQDGDKTFEIRKADRLFAAGDTLVLQEFRPDTGYTGQELTFQISYILSGSEAEAFGIKKGYCVMSFKEKESYV